MVSEMPTRPKRCVGEEDSVLELTRHAEYWESETRVSTGRLDKAGKWNPMIASLTLYRCFRVTIATRRLRTRVNRRNGSRRRGSKWIDEMAELIARLTPQASPLTYP